MRETKSRSLIELLIEYGQKVKTSEKRSGQ